MKVVDIVLIWSNAKIPKRETISYYRPSCPFNIGYVQVKIPLRGVRQPLMQSTKLPD